MKVDFIHRQGLAHCDINSGNFMIQEGEYSKLKLIDYGATT